MTNPVIRVENLGKRYVIGHKGKAKQHDTLRDQLAYSFKSLGKRSSKAQKRAEGTYREDFWALRDLYFDIKQGDRVGIIGRNGAGKSTLLKLLSRITEPTVGDIKIRGRVASLLEVGTGFHAELTGRENIFLNGAILGMAKTEIERKFDEIVAFSEVERFLDTPVKRYSSGMYVRLAFSIAAHLEPEILIVDEVLAVGDAKFREKCLGKMRQVGAEGRTVLFVSHQVGMLSQLCTSAILLEQGRLMYQGKTDDVIARYMESLGYQENIFVASGVEVTSRDAYIAELMTVDESDESASEFGHTDEICLRIKGVVNEYSRGMMLSVSVKDRMDRRVFTNRIELDKWNVDSSTNSFVGTMRIPREFLMSGQYSFFVLLNIPKVKVLHSLDNISPFRVIDMGSSAAQYEGKDIGCVFANCRWDIVPDRAISKTLAR